MLTAIFITVLTLPHLGPALCMNNEASKLLEDATVTKFADLMAYYSFVLLKYLFRADSFSAKK